MWYEKDPNIIDAKLIENRDYAIAFEHQYLDVLKPSDRVFKRDFIIERKRSFDIEDVNWKSWSERKFYNNMVLDLKYEGYISVFLIGRKIGYIYKNRSN